MGYYPISWLVFELKVDKDFAIALFDDDPVDESAIIVFSRLEFFAACGSNPELKDSASSKIAGGIASGCTKHKAEPECGIAVGQQTSVTLFR